MPERSICESVVRQLWPFLDGVISDAEQERVIQHLQQCEQCSSHFEFAKAFLEAVGTSGSASVASDRLRHRVLGALAAEGFTAPH